MSKNADRLAVRRDAFADLAATPVEPGTKGVPPHATPVALGDIGRQGWNLLAGDLTMPVAVLRQSAMRSNSAFMREFLDTHDMALAPHGKTTMAPQIFGMQIDDGAWGMTVSTVQHLAVCRRFAFDRVLIANELVGAAEVDYVFKELTASPELELYCLVDSVAGVERLAECGKQYGAMGRLNCLVEIGYTGGRAGCRTVDQAVEVARAVAEAGLTLAGVEGFEGLLGDVGDVDAFLDRMIEAAERIDAFGLFAPDRSVILSAGGSTYYDRVAEKLRSSAKLADRANVISRSGCYITHDSGAYKDAFAAIRARGASLPGKVLEPALMVFTHVQSRPEPGRVILAMGRRDVGFDTGMPVPLFVYRADRDATARPIDAGHEVVALNDQHAHLSCPHDSTIAVGDLVGFGISHPCTTFDKWQVLFVIDDDYRVVDAIKTFF